MKALVSMTIETNVVIKAKIHAIKRGYNLSSYTEQLWRNELKKAEPAKIPMLITCEECNSTYSEKLGACPLCEAEVVKKYKEMKQCEEDEKIKEKERWITDLHDIITTSKNIKEVKSARKELKRRKEELYGKSDDINKGTT